MKIEIITIFPEIFEGFIKSSLIEKAIGKGALSITLTNPRDFSDPPHFQVDDSPYGGGAGMVMKASPLFGAVNDAKKRLPSAQVVLLSPVGSVFSQSTAAHFSSQQELILVCARYEGVDERFVELCVDCEISIGDYVLMGGEIPAMAIIEASVRLIDGIIGNSESLAEESFASNLGEPLLLEAAHYTRPAEFQGKNVPEILLSGDHARVAAWRKAQSLARTKERRPDLLGKAK